MAKQKISVIIPVYKVEKYLDRCVESVINQTYKNLEIILVDDGSPDNCPKMCDEWAKKDKRIKVIHKKNGGVSSARNEGIKNATGEFVQFLDSDDYIEKTYCENLINATADDVDMVVSGYTIIENNNTMIVSCTAADITDIKNDINEFFKYVNAGLMNSSVNKLYRRQLLSDGFSVGIPLAEDSIFVLNYLMISKNKIMVIDDAGYYYEQNMQSATHVVRNDVLESHQAYWKKLKQYLNVQFETTNHQSYYRMIFEMVFFSVLRSSKDNLKNLKKQIDNNEYSLECLKNFKPQNFKGRVKLFLVKHRMFNLLRLASKIKRQLKRK